MNTPTVKQEAYRLYAAGLNLLPIKTDGSKTPALATWAAYTRMRAGAEEMEAWFGPKAPARGLAVVCGETSGNYIIVDGDMASGEYLIPLAAVTGRLSLTAPADLLAKWEAAPVTHTPTGAWHKHLRCTEPVGKGGKLAMKPTEVPEGTAGARLIGGKWTLVETLIETRAQGQIAVLPPSPPACHPSQKPYVLESGDLTQIPVLTPAELETVLNCSRSFNEFIAPEKIAAEPHRPKTEAQAGEKPGGAYNRRGDREALLERHGWLLGGTRGETELWTRPGKSHGISATFNHAGCGLFYPFSTNADPLESERAYSPFALYAALDHGGDFSAAAKALYAEGYGDRIQKRQAYDDKETSAGGPGGSQEAPGGTEAGGDGKKVLPHVLPSVARLLKGLPATVDAVGLHVAQEATPSERQQIFRGLMRLGGETQLWLRLALGDSYNALAGGRGERIRWVSKHFGAGMLQTVKNYAWVAGRWDHARRNMDLPWTFFVETSDQCFGIVDQDELLTKWFAGGLTVEGIRQIKRERKGTPDHPKEAATEAANADHPHLHQGRAVMPDADDFLGLLPGDCRADIRFLLDNGGTEYLRALLRQGRADLAPDADKHTSGEEQENTLFGAFLDGETSNPLTFLPDDEPPVEAAASPGEEAFARRGEAAEKEHVGETVTLTKNVDYCRDETAGADAPTSAPPDVFPFQSPVRECLRERSWPRAWERWMRFSGWQNGQPVPDEVGQQLAALRPLWDAQHPSTKDSATTRREAAHA